MSFVSTTTHITSTAEQGSLRQNKNQDSLDATGTDGATQSILTMRFMQRLWYGFAHKKVKLFKTYLIPVLLLVLIWAYGVYMINYGESGTGYRVFKVEYVLTVWFALAVGYAHYLEHSQQKIISALRKYIILGLQLVSVGIPLVYVVLLPASEFDFTFQYGLWGFVIALCSAIFGLFSPCLMPWLSGLSDYSRQSVHNTHVTIIDQNSDQHNKITHRYPLDTVCWQYIWQLGLNAILVGIMSVLVFAAVTLIPISLDILFKVDVQAEVYQTIAITIFVLSAGLAYIVEFPSKADMIAWFGVDAANISNTTAVSTHTTFRFPRVLSVILQYVGLPVISIYALILDSFAISIAVRGVWPEEGVIYYMISLISGIVLIIMALEPLLESKRVIRLWARGLYCLSLPPFIAYFYGIIVRILDQGMTPNRYLVVLIGVGLLLIVCNNLINKIPKYTASLSLILILAVVSILGPIGLPATVARSQTDRVLIKLQEINSLRGDVLSPVENVSVEDSVYLSTRFDILENFDVLDVVTNKLDPAGADELAQFKTLLAERRKSDMSESKPAPLESSRFISQRLVSASSVSEWLIQYIGGVYQVYITPEYGDIPLAEQGHGVYLAASMRTAVPITIAQYTQMSPVFSLPLETTPAQARPRQFGFDIYQSQYEQQNSLVILRDDATNQDYQWDMRKQLVEYISTNKELPQFQKYETIEMTDEISIVYQIGEQKVKLVLLSVQVQIQENADIDNLTYSDLTLSDIQLIVLI